MAPLHYNSTNTSSPVLTPFQNHKQWPQLAAPIPHRTNTEPSHAISKPTIKQAVSSFTITNSTNSEIQFLTNPSLQPIHKPLPKSDSPAMAVSYQRRRRAPPPLFLNSRASSAAPPSQIAPSCKTETEIVEKENEN